MSFFEIPQTQKYLALEVSELERKKYLSSLSPEQLLMVEPGMLGHMSGDARTAYLVKLSWEMHATRAHTLEQAQKDEHFSRIAKTKVCDPNFLAILKNEDLDLLLQNYQLLQERETVEAGVLKIMDYSKQTEYLEKIEEIDEKRRKRVEMVMMEMMDPDER